MFIVANRVNYAEFDDFAEAFRINAILSHQLPTALLYHDENGDFYELVPVKKN